MGEELELSPALEAVVEVVGSRNETRTTEVAQALGITTNAAYKRLRKLRDMGIVRSRLDWVNFPDGSGRFSPLRDNGVRRLMSWLWYSLRPRQRWGEAPDRGEFQRMFDPYRNRKETG